MRIGSYEILPTMDKDYFIVRQYFEDGRYIKRKVCGGDVETIFACFFIETERIASETK